MQTRWRCSWWLAVLVVLPGGACTAEGEGEGPAEGEGEGPAEGEGEGPAAALDTLAGEALAGEWGLQVTDWDPTEDEGVLRGWSLRLTWLSATDVLVDGTLVVGGEDLEDTLAGLRQSVAALTAEVWCLRHCHAGQDDCRVWVCDGEAQTCEDAGPADDGTPCFGGRRVCLDGVCCRPTTCAGLLAECGEHDDGCGGVLDCGLCEEGERCSPAGRCQAPCGGLHCPFHPLGWPVTCNALERCEYAPADDPLAAEILVPPGVFTMGRDGGHFASEPEHAVTFASGFLIGKYEVTAARYEACEAAGACPAPSVEDGDGCPGFPPRGVNRSPERATEPQNGLQWSQARTFCQWIGGRLPSDAEWEYAAKGPEARRYPWGDDRPTCGGGFAVMTEPAVAECGCAVGGTWPVGSMPAGASWVGGLDMCGNVDEWVEDCWHDSYEGAPADGSAWTVDCGGENRPGRGGAWWESFGRGTADRVGWRPDYRSGGLGARCARDLP